MTNVENYSRMYQKFLQLPDTFQIIQKQYLAQQIQKPQEFTHKEGGGPIPYYVIQNFENDNFDLFL